MHDCTTLLQDIYTLFHLSRPFKFISKTSNFLIPIVGWSMFMTGQSFSSISVSTMNLISGVTFSFASEKYDSMLILASFSSYSVVDWQQMLSRKSVVDTAQCAALMKHQMRNVPCPFGTMHQCSCQSTHIRFSPLALMSSEMDFKKVLYNLVSDDDSSLDDVSWNMLRL